ncbi:unnamed protein product [Sphagnum jensenii]|uniref:Glucose-6-phosphate isomerase n=1 Tax=Sphagnum jensenii TaxID=128206 RepID=A0ABP0VXV6_9BRYO
MESNGKGVSIDGIPLPFDTGEIDFGEPGEIVSNHDELMCNFFAQADALAYGKTPEELRANGVPDFLTPHKLVVLPLGTDHAHCFYGQVSGEGNHFPDKSKDILELTDYAVQLLALYEHRVATMGFISGINSFDQWGLDLGKRLRSAFASARASTGEWKQLHGNQHRFFSGFASSVMASAPHLSLPLAASSSQFSKPQVYWKLVQFAALPASCRIGKISFYGSEIGAAGVHFSGSRLSSLANNRRRRFHEEDGSRRNKLKKVGVWRAAAGEINRKSWDFGRFVNKLLFFNGPPSLQKFVASVVQAMTGRTDQADVEQANRNKKQEEVVLVVGATGGVGKRVVDELWKRGYRTRALVRNLEKAKQLLSSEVEIVTADITQAATLLPEYFAGVKKVVHAASVTVGPKEGDTADR